MKLKSLKRLLRSIQTLAIIVFFIFIVLDVANLDKYEKLTIAFGSIIVWIILGIVLFRISIEELIITKINEAMFKTKK